MAPRGGANRDAQREKEISDLINAVKEHQKFKQLACYSIQALDKAIDPEANKNTWRESVALAIRLDAAAVVCSILQRHPGHENVLLVCVECLRKLATDKTNAIVIAEQNAVPYLLESIKANPNLPEEVLHMAMSLLNNLCSFSKVSAMVLNEDTLRSVLGVIESNNDPLVLNSCINIVEKMSKVQTSNKGGMRSSMDDGQMAKMIQLNKLLNESCVPAMLKALENLSKSDIIDDQAEDLVVSITRVLSRLAAQSPEVEQRLKVGGGIDSYLAVMETFKSSDRVTKASSKLISKMMGDNIGELMNTLKTGSLSNQAQERVLSLISSMAMDSSSMDEIMKSDGVSAMISSMETAMSSRALEETARTVARLASSPKHVPQLLESGALSQICKILTSPTLSVSSNLDMQASMSLAINRIAVAAPTALDEVVSNPQVMAALVDTLAKNPSHPALARSTLELFGRFSPEQLSKMKLEPMMTAIIAAMACIDVDKDVTTATAALAALDHALAAGGGTSVSSLIRAGAIPLALTTLNGGAAREHGAVAVSSLNFLSHLARVGGDEALKALRDGNAFAITVEAVGGHMENATVRSAAADMIQLLSSDELIKEFGNTLSTFATKFEQGQASDAEIGAIPQLALSLGALAMSPENIPKIQAAGGVAPMITLMGAIADMKDYPNQGELLVTFASCLAEVCGSGVNLDSIDSDVLMKNAVAVLSKHSSDTSACNQALRLIRTACAAGDMEPSSNGGQDQSNRFMQALLKHGGVDSIATQVRLHPTDDAELLSHAFTIFSDLAMSEQSGNKKAMDIIQRSGRQIVRCLEENAEMVESNSTHNLDHLMPAMFVLECCANTPEGRAITSKLGSVKAIMSVLSAASNDEEVSAACGRTLAAVVTENDVLKVVDRLDARLGALRENPGDEALVSSVSDDVKKLGLLMMCGDFSGAITEAGGVQHLVDIIALVETSNSKSSPAHEALTASCITAFGRAAATGTLNVRNAHDCIPAIVRLMTEDPTAEVLLAVGALATCDSTILNGLVHHGAVDALVPLLQSGFEGLSDGSGGVPTDAINACFRALSAFCVTSEGCESVVSSGGLAFVVEHLRENMVNSSSSGESGLALAVGLLSNVARNGGSSGIDVNKELLSAGVLNLVTDALRDLRLVNPEAVAVADLTALSNLQSLLATMATDKGNGKDMSAAKAILAAGVIQQVDALMQQNIFISSNDCALATNSLLNALAGAGCGDELKKLDSDALLMRLMNANATDVEVARACAGTMGAVSGENSGSTFTALLRKAEGALDKFTALCSADPSPTDLETELKNVNASLQLLANLILMDEAVNQMGADEVMALTQRSLAQLASLGAKDQNHPGLDLARDAATASALTLLGRLANLDYVEVDTDKATEATAAFFVEDDTVSDTVLASAVSCIGGVASSARGVKSIARHGMVARVQRKIQPKSGRVGHVPTENQQLLQSVCATALDAIKTTAVSNAATLVKAEGGASAIASILTGIATDATKPKNLNITLDQIIKEVGGLQVLLGALTEMAVTKFQGNGQRKAADAIISAMLVARDSGTSYLEVSSPAACIALIEGGGLQDLSPPESAAARRAARKKGGPAANDKQRLLEVAKAKAADALKLAAPSAASVALLERLPASNAGMLIATHTPGVIDAMSFSINSPNLAVCSAAVGFLSKVAHANTGAGNARLLSSGTPGRCAASLKQLLQPIETGDGDTAMINLLSRGRPFLESSFYLLATLAHTCGIKKMDLEPDALRVNSSLIEQLSVDNSNAYALAQAKRFGAKLMEAFEDGAEALLEDALKEVAGRSQDLLAWQGIEDGKGGIYYFNSKTTETTWERPEAHTTLVGDLEDIVELVDTIGGAEHVDPRSLIRALVPLLTTHARDRVVSKLVCSLLAGACRSPEATALLGVMEQVGDVVVVLDGHSHDLELVMDATDMIFVLSEDEVFRDTLSNAVYIGMLLRTAKKYVANAVVLQRCLASLGAIAALSVENTGACLNENAAELVGLSMETHPDDAEVSNSSLLLMEQVLVGLDEFGEEDEEPFGDEDEREEKKLQACNIVIKPLLAAMTKFSIDKNKTEVNESGEDSEFFLLAVRCMGSFSLVDRCIVAMVEKGCSKLTVEGMRFHMNCVDAVTSGMELISNLGAIEDDDIDEEMTRYLIDEEAPQIIIEVMNRYDTSVPVLLVTYEALYNIGNDEAAAEIFVKMGVIKLAFTTIQNFDYEKLLVAQVMKFLSVMSYDERAVEEIAVLGWLPIVFQAIQTRLDNEEFVLDAVMVICNSVNDPRSQQIVVEDRALLHQLLDLLNTYDESVDVAQQVVITCSRLATNEEVSLLMAAEGMPFFMRTTADLGMADTELLGHLFGLLFYLAFQKENIKVIVQHGGIRVLCAVMEVDEYQNDSALMMKALGMMDNVVSADEEFSDIVADKGGKLLVEQLKNLHMDDPEMVSTATSVLLTMEAMAKQKQEEGSKTGRAALFARLGGDAVSLEKGRSIRTDSAAVEPIEDPLILYRGQLVKGVTVRVWNKGLMSEQRFSVPDSFNAIILKDIKSKAGVRLPLRNMDAVLAGYGENHMKKSNFGGASCKDTADRCLRVNEKPKLGETKEVIALSFKTKEEFDEWFPAISRLVETNKNWSHRLKDPRS